MTINLTLLRSCLQLIVDPAWWYLQAVEHYADVFWLAGGGDLLIRTIETVCLNCEVPQLSESLSRRLADTYQSPHDQYLLTVSLAASALWAQGDSEQLLIALHALVGFKAPP